MIQVGIYNFQDRMVNDNVILNRPLDAVGWLRVLHIIIYNENFEVLLCQNTPGAEYFPSKWDIGVWGFLQSAENLLDSASRICNEKLAIHVEANKFRFLAKHSEIGIHSQKDLLKTHVQTLGCQVSSGKIGLDRIDYNLFNSVDWEHVNMLRDRVSQKPEEYAYHPSHSLASFKRVNYWDETIRQVGEHIQTTTKNNLFYDFHKLSQAN